MERVGNPSIRYASRGVHTICLGPRAKKPEMQGDHIVIAIFGKNDWVVRELREESVEEADVSNTESGLLDSTAVGLTIRTRLVDVSPEGETYVIHEDAQALAGDAFAWNQLIDSWSSKFGVPQ